MKKIAIYGLNLAAVANFCSCASIHDGNFAYPDGEKKDEHKSKSGIVISGKENSALSSEHFGELDLTFENLTSDWIKIKKVSIDFLDPALNEQVQIPVGSELVAWARAAERNKQISDYNTSLVLGSVMALGFVAASAGAANGSPAFVGVGSIAAAGSGSILAVKSLSDERMRVGISQRVPATHLLAEDFLIPPGLHAQRWVTFYTKKAHAVPQSQNILISYEIENGKTEKAYLHFREYDSKW